MNGHSANVDIFAINGGRGAMGGISKLEFLFWAALEGLTLRQDSRLLGRAFQVLTGGTRC